jgi:hypothetical protein
MKGFPKASYSRTNSFPKVVKEYLRNPQKSVYFSGFQDLIAVTDSFFGHPFMTALAAFGKIGRISKDFL